jgi:type II secretory pathway pseudopilin PulG
MGRKNLRPRPKITFLETGLTLTEILVVVAILGTLILLVFLTIKPSYQMARARDGRRKTDLKKIATAVEDYGGDHPCYPASVYENADTCRPATGFAAYLNPIPCDPQTKKPYVYRRLDAPACKKYAVFATLELEETITYGSDAGNYVVSNVRVEPTPITPGVGGGEGDTPSPTTPPVSFYGCFSGVCLPISGPEQCDPNYQVGSPCEGGACCFDKCGTLENPEHECD